jgi:asparagine synthase (glutamine-hydrolysing)
MCGITGWVAFEHELARERETVEAMTATMACRGPDAEGIWIDGHAALGHRRLAIIDLEGGAQPMSAATPAGDVVLVYSGEVYNYRELRAELEAAGQRFTTASDTEVVLRAYLQWGEGLAERLNGMFAFAIWDAGMRRLVLVRDRLGIKPLYFYRTFDGVLFGSEPKAILANPLARREVCADGMRELFSYVRTPGHAVWSGMHDLQPGTVVTVDADGVRERRYWSLSTRAHADDRDETVAHVRELLDDIVRRQLISDVPRCVLLSGGLDSSTVTALAARFLAEDGERVRSFAVDFVGQTEHFEPDTLRPTPDTPYVHDVAEHVGADHRDIVLDNETLSDRELRRRVTTANDLPTGMGDMYASLYLLCQAIRGHSTVALSGESADELFGGYQQFHDPAIQRADEFPWLVKGDLLGMKPDSFLAPGIVRELDLPTYRRDAYASALAEVEHLDGEDELQRRMRVSSHLHLTRFLRYLLDRKDRMSMAVGLEVRVPFCDHRLVEYVYNAPWALKTYDGREKSLLRGAARDVLPRSVVERVKSPYPSTQDPHYVATLQRQAREVLEYSEDGVLDLVDRAWLNRVTRPNALIGTADRQGLEWTLNLEAWLDIYRPRLSL